jgi:hypothetical protein
MNADALIAARVPADTKQRFAAVARHQGVSESVLLRRLVDAALITAVPSKEPAVERVESVGVTGKISVCLRPDDFTLVRERAAGRQMPTGTYVAHLVRSHLRNLSPLPTTELKTLKCSIAELGAIGRNLNQIARALNYGEERRPGPDAPYLRTLLKVLTGLRDDTKALITANVLSWQVGYEKKSH